MSQHPAQRSLAIHRTKIHSIDAFEGGVKVSTDRGVREYPGCYVFPGLVDAHAHIVGLGMVLDGLSLFGLESAEACARRAYDHGATRGEWVSGMGWNQELWSEPIYPHRALLDELFPSTPVYLRRVDGHAAWVNSEALRRASIDDHTADPIGGTILRDASGHATGILIDTAMDLVAKQLPDITAVQLRQSIQTALRHCSAAGLTEIHDMDVMPWHLEHFRELAEQGELSCRVQSWVRGQEFEWLEQGILPNVGEFQQTIGVKFYADGALGSRGAALLESYSDVQNEHGLLFLTHAELEERCTQALAQGFHVATHAIGDAANRLVLDVYQNLRRSGIADPTQLLRIEHAQIVNASDVNRFAESSIIASIQPIHCTSDAPMAEKRLGERCVDAYRWKSLLAAGTQICGGSDFPIESFKPLTGIDAFCRRLPAGYDQSWYASERLDRQSALLAYTDWAHQAADMAYRRGKLQAGFDADFVIVDRDLLHCADEDLLSTSIVATYCGGQLQYEA